MDERPIRDRLVETIQKATTELPADVERPSSNRGATQIDAILESVAIARDRS